jgi:pimeloyl-ACP methyl ester carboxylesterase
MKATVNLFFEQIGQGTPLVLVHGYPLDHTTWKPIIPFLKSNVRAILPDLRGFGKSPVADGIYSMELLAGDICALLDQLKIQKAVIIGHSMGGYVSLAFARLFPERLLGIGLVGSKTNADAPDKVAGRKEMAEAIQQQGMQATLDRMLANLTRDTDVAKQITPIMLSTSPQAGMGASLGMAERVDSTAMLRKLDLPGLVMVGTDDPFSPVQPARELAQSMKNARLVEIDRAGHMMMMEQPQVVATGLNDFLALFT